MICLSKKDARAQLEKDAEEKREQEERHKAWKQAYNARKERYKTAQNKALTEMEIKWGKCTKEIFVDYNDTFSLSDRIYAFEDAGKIVLGGTEYNFSDIIGFSMINNSKTIYNAYTTAKSQKNTGGMITRGIAGKVIGGDTGTIIGAITAEEDYECDTEYDSEVENDYKIYINVNSISSPTVVIHFGTTEEDAYETANLLNVIIKRND